MYIHSLQIQQSRLVCELHILQSTAGRIYGNSQVVQAIAKDDRTWIDDGDLLAHVVR